MSNIWNPHAFGVTGQPVGPQVNTLRVYGAEPSKEQLAMAQQTFAKFCANSRLSLAPNQTQQGFLPDGSKYRIVVVGNTRIMEVRPDGDTGDAGDLQRGVGVEAMFSGVPKLFILSYIKGRWRVKGAEEFYGGSGVWVGNSGRYITDDTVVQKGNRITPRRFLPGVRETKDVRAGTSSVRKGLAYQGWYGTGFGIFTKASKFAYVVPLGNASVDVYEAQEQAESSFAVTPDEPALLEYVGRVYASGAGSGANTSPNLRRHGGYSRLRDASAMMFPGAEINHDKYQVEFYSLLVYLADGDHIAGRELTHELQVNLLPDGSYTADFLRRAANAQSEELPVPIFGDRHTTWERTISQSITVHSVSAGTTPCVLLHDGGALTGNAASGITTDYTWKRDSVWGSSYTVKDRTVYLGRTWGGDLLTMKSDLVETHEVVEDYRRDWLTVRTTFVEGEACLPPTLHFGQTKSPDLGPDGPGVGIAFGKALHDSVSPDPHDTEVSKARYTRKRLATLETPWGTLKLIDEESACTGTFTIVDGVRDEATYDRDMGGSKGTYRELKFIDHLLGLIGFVEITAGKYEVVKTGRLTHTISTADSHAKFVLQLRGSTIVEFEIGGLMEATVNLNGVDFYNFRTSFAEFQETPGIPADGTIVSISVTTDSWRAVHTPTPDGLRTDYIPVTYTSEVGAREYSFTRTNMIGVPPKSKAPVSIRPTVDYSAFSVKVNAAIDPNSGGGVVTVHDGGDFKGGWAIAPDGSKTPLSQLLTTKSGAPDHIQDLVVSV